MLEIERKFLVHRSQLEQDLAQRQIAGIPIRQGYLNRDPQRCVRVRLADQSASLTIKGPASDDGTTREEWEFEIDVAAAAQILKLCEPTPIVKTRYRIPMEQLTWEVDIFEGNNAGLILAEVELESPDQSFPRPDWIAQEVTGDPRYYNARLSTQPYRSWRADSNEGVTGKIG